MGLHRKIILARLTNKFAFIKDTIMKGCSFLLRKNDR